jgi:hypothetical protein
MALDVEWDRERRVVIETLGMDNPTAWRFIQDNYYQPWQRLWQYRRRVLLALRHYPGVLEKLLHEQEAWEKRRKPRRYTDVQLIAILRQALGR